MTQTLKTLSEYLKDNWDKVKKVKFQPSAFHNEIADEIEVYWEDTPSYSDHLNPYIHIHKADDDDRIVGVTICGVKQMLRGESVPPREA